FPGDRVLVKYNGIAAPAEPDAIPAAATNRTFLFAGQLEHRKGVTVLLDAWRLAGPRLDAELRFIGQGPLAPEVRAAAAVDSRITWVGQVPSAEMPSHLAAARVVMVPSTWEEP